MSHTSESREPRYKVHLNTGKEYTENPNSGCKCGLISVCCNVTTDSSSDDTKGKGRADAPRPPPPFSPDSWIDCYRECIRYFVVTGQFQPAAQTLSAFVNIRLPFQRPVPDAPKQSSLQEVLERSLNPDVGILAPNDGQPWISASYKVFDSLPGHTTADSSEYPEEPVAGPSNSNLPPNLTIPSTSTIPSGSRGPTPFPAESFEPTTTPRHSPPPIPSPTNVMSPSLTKAAYYGWVSPVPYIRRLVVTGNDQNTNFLLWFGPNWERGMAMTIEHERRNMFLAARESTWLQVKESYDIGFDESVPYVCPRKPDDDEEWNRLGSYWYKWTDFRRIVSVRMPRKQNHPQRPPNEYQDIPEVLPSPHAVKEESPLSNGYANSSGSKSPPDSRPIKNERLSPVEQYQRPQPLKRSHDEFDEQHLRHLRETNGKRARHDSAMYSNEVGEDRRGSIQDTGGGRLYESFESNAGSASGRAWIGGEAVGSSHRFSPSNSLSRSPSGQPDYFQPSTTPPNFNSGFSNHNSNNNSNNNSNQASPINHPAGSLSPILNPINTNSNHEHDDSGRSSSTERQSSPREQPLVDRKHSEGSPGSVRSNGSVRSTGCHI